MKRSQRLKKPLDARGIDLLIEAGGAKARERFADFRRFMHPEMHWGWASPFLRCGSSSSAIAG
jgi:hypothetical protein